MTNIDERIERRARRFWVSFVMTFLGLQLVIGGVAVYLSTGDRSVAVVPNYHQAAMNWDDAKQAKSAVRRLGWTVKFSSSDVADERGMRALELHINDTNRDAINEMKITGHIYHHALASDLKPIEFRAVGDGRYMTMAPMSKAGLWEIELTIDGASEPMAISKTLEISAGGV